MQESGRINRDRFLSWQPGGGAGCTVTRRSTVPTGRISPADRTRLSPDIIDFTLWQPAHVHKCARKRKEEEEDWCVSSPFRSPWKYNNAWKVIFSPHSVSVRGETAAVFVFVLVAPVKLRFLLLLFSISLLPLFKTELSFRLAASWGGVHMWKAHRHRVLSSKSFLLTSNLCDRYYSQLCFTGYCCDHVNFSVTKMSSFERHSLLTEVYNLWVEGL